MVSAQGRLSAVLEKAYGIRRPERGFISLGDEEDEAIEMPRVSTPEASEPTRVKSERKRPNLSLSWTPPPMTEAVRQSVPASPEEATHTATQQAPQSAAPNKKRPEVPKMETMGPGNDPESYGLQAAFDEYITATSDDDLEAISADNPVGEAPDPVAGSLTPSAYSPSKPPDGIDQRRLSLQVESQPPQPRHDSSFVGRIDGPDDLEFDLFSSAGTRHQDAPPQPRDESVAPVVVASPRVSSIVPAQTRKKAVPSKAARREHLQRCLSELGEIADRDIAVDCALHYLKSEFDVALLLVVRDGVAYGFRGYAPNVPEDVLESAVVPLSVPSAFQPAAQTARTYCGPPPADGVRIHARLWKLLGTEPPESLIVAPITIGQKLVNLLYLQAPGGGNLAPHRQGNVSQLASALGLCYGRAIRAATAPQRVAGAR
jgi:hypothetical protein